MSEIYFLITGKNLLAFAEDWRTRVSAAAISASNYAKSLGAESYYAGLDGELIGLPILTPKPEGWTANKKIGRMYPQKGVAGDKVRAEIEALAQPPRHKDLVDLIKYPGSVSYEHKGMKGFTGIGFPSNPLYSAKLAWTPQDFILVVADPRPVIEKLKKDYPGVKITHGDWVPPKGLKQISKAECDFIFAQAALNEEKKQKSGKCGHCKCGNGGCHK